MENTKPSSESILKIREKSFMSHDDFSVEQLKDFFLRHPLFAQFKDNPDKFKIEVIEPGQLIVQLSNFKGLDLTALNPRAFHTLEIPQLNIKSGHILSGGPAGVSISYVYGSIHEMNKGHRYENQNNCQR